MEPDIGWSLEALLADTRALAKHTASDLTELRHDVRRLDDRIFQLMLLTLATLATALASLVTTLVS
jgi:hypothetical protein